MKIKEVCELTGLSDRAVRFYISKGLVMPEYNENYKGRKSFEFSDNNVKRLSEIAVLRKVDFSIEEIKQIIKAPSSSYKTVLNISKRKEEEMKSKESVDKLLDKLMPGISYNIGQLAELLKKDTKSLKYPNEDEKLKFTDVFIWIKDNIFRLIMFISSFLIFMTVLFIFIENINNKYRYVCIYSYFWVFIVITICPVIISLYRLISNRNNIPLPFSGIEIFLKSVITLIIIFFDLMFSLFFTILIQPFYSQTTDIRNYMILDAQCVANEDTEMKELFPAWVPWNDITNEKYYYKYFQGLDYTYDIIAQWQLNNEEFYKEIERVKNEFTDYEKIIRGEYNCLFFRDVIYSETQTSVSNSYDFLIFAYNENTNTVRYICCSSLENGADQPYFFEMEW